MSQILAVLNGPAFYPLPGIGRVFSSKETSVGLESVKMKEYMEAQTKAAKAKRAEILRLIQEEDHTLAELMDLTDSSDSCVKDHLRELQKVGVFKRREANTVYFCVERED